MRIAQIQTGLLPIPPNGWGAIEKIIWNYSQQLNKLGHEVDILDINNPTLKEYDIVHAHIWNHCDRLHEIGVPYIFTFHDHHAFHYGKGEIYNNNLRAMKNSLKSIVPAKYLIEYFENIPIYLRHGVDVSYYKQYNRRTSNTKLLCVGNNGLSGNVAIDRKGFRPAIEAANILSIPITIVGPTNSNKSYFESNNDLLKENVSVKYDLTDDELLQEFNDASILLHMSEIEAGHPPLTILEAAATGLPVITTDCNGDLHVTNCKRDISDIISSINDIKSNYADEKIKTLDSVKIFDWINVVKDLQLIYLHSLKGNMRTSVLNTYKNAKRHIHINRFNVNFVNGPFIEILGKDSKTYNVSFINIDTNETLYSTVISNNSWAKLNARRFVNVKIVAISSDGEYFEHEFDANDKRVYIAFESSSLGDTLAWIPYAEEFRKKWNCDVIVSTFMNHLFEESYPHIKFVKPGTVVDGLYAMYTLGIFDDGTNYDMNKHKIEPNKLPLQGVASDILGLNHVEIKPKIKNIKNKNDEILNLLKTDKYICIAIHSTSQTKYWNNENGWQSLVDYAKSLGYEVLLISKENDGHMGNKTPDGVIKISNKSLEEIGEILKGSKAFIGLGSGLTWYAWSLSVPTMLISGFSYKYQEMQSDIIRIINESVCHGCFGRYLFDRGDWNWCPDHKGTERQFECTKSITFDQVKPHLDTLLL